MELNRQYYGSLKTSTLVSHTNTAHLGTAESEAARVSQCSNAAVPSLHVKCCQAWSR